MIQVTDDWLHRCCGAGGSRGVADFAALPLFYWLSFSSLLYWPTSTCRLKKKVVIMVLGTGTIVVTFVVKKLINIRR